MPKQKLHVWCLRSVGCRRAGPREAEVVLLATVTQSGVHSVNKKAEAFRQRPCPGGRVSDHVSNHVLEVGERADLSRISVTNGGLRSPREAWSIKRTGSFRFLFDKTDSCIWSVCVKITDVSQTPDFITSEVFWKDYEYVYIFWCFRTPILKLI